ncbi:MAG TPA: Hsp20/alpha crystallin family protein [Blastocatellia bacterium]|nr:Hsp20/alpha crystallin family protein [Blastocatellia bacterium]
MAKTGTAIAPSQGFRNLLGYDPFRGVFDFQRRALNEAMQNFEGDAAAIGAWTPAVDVYEDENTFIIKLELPEIKREDVKVTLDKNVVTVSGERRLENEEKRDHYHRVERNYGRFFRSFTLSPNANVEAISAEFKEGVLRLSVPKKEEAKPKQIQVEIK